VVNQNKGSAEGVINLTVGHNKYKIKRRTEKYTKRLYGKESQEARVILDFSKKDMASGEYQSLNGITRNETDKAIRKSFGSVDDFLLTSYASQMGSLAFVEEGNTKRKEILAKFLDLELFDMKYRYAKDEAKELLGYLKTMESVDYATEIEQCKEALSEVRTQISEQDKKCKRLANKKERTTRQISEIRKEIENVPASLMNISNVLDVLEKKSNDLLYLERDVGNYRLDAEEILEEVSLLENKNEKVDAFEMRRKVSRAEELRGDIAALQQQLEKALEEQESANDTAQCPECGAELDHKSEFERQIATFQELIDEKAKKQKECDAEDGATHKRCIRHFGQPH
jgi:DNA repair exonuclease SbcCD ATPase subunit